MPMLLFFVLISNPFGPDLQLQNAVVNQDGIFLASKNKIIHQTFEGEILAEIDAKPFDPILVTPNGYLVKDSFSWELRLLDKKGNLVEKFANIGWRNFSFFSKDLIVATPLGALPSNLRDLKEKRGVNFEFSPFLKRYDLGSNPAPYMIDFIRIEDVGKSYQFTLENSIFRMTDEQRRFNFNFKKMFILSVENTFFIMTEMNNLLYVYDDETISKERSTDPHQSFEKPSLPLELDGFVSVNDNPYKLKPIYFDDNEWAQDHRIQTSSFSRIFDFSKTEFGFQVTYSVPKKNKDATGLVDIYIQEIDSSGQNRGESKVFRDLRGRFAGIAKGDLYWLSMDPGKRSGIVEVYQID